jgi:short-subunit dehydrogenase
MSKNPIRQLSGLAVVTGASSGIGLELAKRAAADGCELILVARGDLSEAEDSCRQAGAPSTQAVHADLATAEGIEAVLQAIGDRPVAALFANAGTGKGGAFLDQPWEDLAQTINTNVTGTVKLVHAVGQRMLARGQGRILVTGSIVGDIPGAFNLAYNSTKAFINDFCVGLAEELKGTPIVISCLLPGGTETPFFNKAGMEDTIIGRAPKADPSSVAHDGYRALLKGETRIVSGFMNKVMFHFADLLPAEFTAQMHRVVTQSDHPPKGRTPA